MPSPNPPPLLKSSPTTHPARFISLRTLPEWIKADTLPLCIAPSSVVAGPTFAPCWYFMVDLGRVEEWVYHSPALILASRTGTGMAKCVKTPAPDPPPCPPPPPIPNASGPFRLLLFLTFLSGRAKINHSLATTVLPLLGSPPIHPPSSHSLDTHTPFCTLFTALWQIETIL